MRYSTGEFTWVVSSIGVISKTSIIAIYVLLVGLFGLMLYSICIYGFSFSLPTIILELGYTAAQAQLLTIPIYFVGACSTILFAYLADKRQNRWIFIIIPFAISAIGFIALLSIPHPRLPGLTYAFLFTIPTGLYPAVISCISWVGNSLAPTWKRAIGMALMMSIGNLGGAVGSNIFLENQAPKYQLGYGFSMGMRVSSRPWSCGSLLAASTRREIRCPRKKY